eukprot:5822873-Pleurochrysis_carterae.AAC.2
MTLTSAFSTKAGVNDPAVEAGISYFNTVGGGGLISDGGLVVFSAGNDGTNDNWFPASLPNVIAVAG